jgi:hypothetical protein
MKPIARAADVSPVENVILTLVVIEVPGRGYCWKLHTGDGDTMAESPVFPSLHHCLTDARHSAPLNPGRDPYMRRT